MIFPQYRRLADRNYYKIISADEFEEHIIIGQKYSVLFIKAVQYPDKLRISDMLDLELIGLEKINSKEYEDALEFSKSNRTKI